MSQDQAMGIVERDPTYAINASLATHCHRQGAIQGWELGQILESQREAALRRYRLAEERKRNRPLQSVGQAMNGRRP